MVSGALKSLNQTRGFVRDVASQAITAVEPYDSSGHQIHLRLTAFKKPVGTTQPYKA